MSITDELRVVAAKTECANGRCEKLYRGDLDHIADRIDAEHERAVMSAMNDALYHANEKDMAELGWIRLPKDADGVPWHIGDRTESGQTVGDMGLNKHGWYFVGTVNEIDPSIHRHYHAPTVEDVLREFVRDFDAWRDYDGPINETPSNPIAEYAKRLTLAEGEDA